MRMGPRRILKRQQASRTRRVGNQARTQPTHLRHRLGVGVGEDMIFLLPLSAADEIPSSRVAFMNDFGAASEEAAETEDDEDEDDDEDRPNRNLVDDYTPHVLILSSGDITPFELRIVRQPDRAEITMTMSLLGEFEIQANDQQSY